MYIPYCKLQNHLTLSVLQSRISHPYFKLLEKTVTGNPILNTRMGFKRESLVEQGTDPPL